MKKLYTLLTALLLTGLSFGQSARLVLVEEFTGETCGPCAASNPNFNLILDAHASNVISLKYENHIPTVGPNFYQYGITDIDARSVYYNNYSGANAYSPHAFIDGNYWNGNCASVTSLQLTTRAGVTSPFDVNVTHSFSPLNDIIYVHTVIRATQSVAAGTYKARIAVAERNVYGYTSPNGETEFSHVVRKLLPDGAGVVLPTTWAAGDSAVVDQQWTIAASPTSYPMPIWAMLEAVVVVQNDVNKQVLQTGHSPASIAVDPAIVGMSAPTVSCTGSVAATITVTNNEASAVTSLDIEYSIDGQTPAVQTWTGTINQGVNVNITLPAISILPGSHTITANITNVNGAPDVLPINNTYTISCGQPLAASTILSQTFASQTFPPQDWVKEDNDHVAGWIRSAANSNPPGTGSAKMDFLNSPVGQIDVLYPLTPADLSTAIAPVLIFKVAHQQYNTSGVRSNDKIEVLASTDCGGTWTALWTKSGSTLATVANGNHNPYTPALSHWRDESIDLSAYIGQTDVLFAFKATSDHGNNAYIDQIFLSPWNVQGIAENNNSAMVSMYPTPSTGNININVEKLTAAKMDISVTNVLGKVVKQMSYDKSEGNVISIDLSNEANGNYLVKIVTANETILKRAVIQK